MRPSDRQRAIGWVVLGSGLVAGAARYWIMTRDADLALNDATALGYSRSLQHGMDVMMGRSGQLLTDMSNVMTSPAGEALIIAGGAALLAAYFFRVAWVLDDADDK
jgi:hypothetical protein